MGQLIFSESNNFYKKGIWKCFGTARHWERLEVLSLSSPAQSHSIAEPYVNQNTSDPFGNEETVNEEYY